MADRTDGGNFSTGRADGLGGPARQKGSGLFLLYKGKAVFGVKSVTPSVSAGDEVLVGLTGIGGKVEPGETFREAAVRECLEEIGCAPIMADFAAPLVVGARKAHPGEEANLGRTPTEIGPDMPDRSDGSSESDGSLFVVYLKPIPGFDKDLEVRVFGGVLREQPQPIEKLQHILLIPPQLLKAIDESHPTLRSFLEQGVEVISADLGTCPLDGRLTFIDSPGVYVRELGLRLAGFAADILRTSNSG